MQPFIIHCKLPSVLLHYWLGDRKGIWSVKKSCIKNCHRFSLAAGRINKNQEVV